MLQRGCSWFPSKCLSRVRKMQKPKPRIGELGARFAGHSKWQNIRHTKTAKDQAKSTLIARHIKDIETAAAKGSTDPNLNSELGRAVSMAEKSNVPAATIKRALTRVEFRKKNPVTKTLMYKGVRGVYVLLTTITDDFSRTRSELSKIVKKYKFVSFLGESTAAFYSKGWIFAKPPESGHGVADKSLEDAIEVGAEDVEKDEQRPECLKFICESSELNKVKSKLEGRQYAIEEAFVMYLPRMAVELPESDMESVNNMMEEIEELPEVEKVFANIA